jgi:F420-dependent oxidoreductase-like protein
VRFSLWPGPHNDWPELLALARSAEAQGWHGLWLADHFMPNGPEPGPVHESWTALAALAVSVPRLRLGPLVSGNTYRHPALLAKMAAGVDRMSGGRLVLGIGAAWQQNEHRAYGFAFPSLRERLARLDEACSVLRGLLAGERTSFRGRYYQLEDATLDPKPIQRPPPLLVGGGGERVTLRIAARHADAWNCWGTPELLRHKNAVLDRHAAEEGREPAAIRRTAVALVRLVDDPDRAARARADTAPPSVTGTPEQLVARMHAYRDAGVDEFIVPDFNLGRGNARAELLERFASEVAAPLR